MTLLSAAPDAAPEPDSLRAKEQLARQGITMFSDARKPGRPSNGANTYVFCRGNCQYVVDPGFGARRRRELLEFLDSARQIHVLCTHYHNDHTANNGTIAGRHGTIYYHHALKDKIRYLRTNGTGQILEMAKRLDLDGMLRRFRMFPGWLVWLVNASEKLSEKLPLMFLFFVSYAYSLRQIGRIHSGRDRARYLQPEDLVPILMDNLTTNGWALDDDLVAMDAPGHTDDHLIFYLKEGKVLFTGDALNFLNGNDIQFGDIGKVDATLSRIREFVEREGVNLLLQGHFPPVTGTRNIMEVLQDIQARHRELYSIAAEVVRSMDIPFCFDAAYDQLCRYPSDRVRDLARRSFPRSTLVFLDVYLYKVLMSLGYIKNKDGFWTGPQAA